MIDCPICHQFLLNRLKTLIGQNSLYDFLHLPKQTKEEIVRDIRLEEGRFSQWLLRCKLLNTILPNFRDFTILGDEQSCTP